MVLVPFILFLASATSYKPVPPVKCGVNEYAVPCKTICPPQMCNINPKEYLCDEKPTCIPGCDCIDGHLRNNEKICIVKEKCPGWPNLNKNISNIVLEELEMNCSITNASSFQTQKNCSESSFSSSSSSSTLDQSSSNYDLSHTFSTGIGGDNSKHDCTHNSCTPTCSLPYSPTCPPNSNPCNCPPGTIISEEGGKCVPKEECPKYANCQGDYNASFTDCPFECPSTCDKPDADFCNTTCGNIGCACNPGFILSKANGSCIKPEDCPGGKACGHNETFVDCSNKCPSIYCPVNDDRNVLICEPENRCPSGCSCKKNYKRKSIDEYICILASDCPPVNCTRPNEEWNPCPKPCFSDHCRERNKVMKPGDCPYSDLDCIPQCICKHGFYRNGTDICVTAQECSLNDSRHPSLKT